MSQLFTALAKQPLIHSIIGVGFGSDKDLSKFFLLFSPLAGSELPVQQFHN